MTDKQEYAKVATREKRFSTLAEKEGKGAEQRAKREKGPAKKDSEWEAKVDKKFQRIRTIKSAKAAAKAK